jgi:ankyrin repeat protein
MFFSHREYKLIGMALPPQPGPADSDAAALFERAADAVVDGDIATLTALLTSHPALVSQRASHLTDRHPPVHRATLLHYVAANGVEDIRQRSPQNAVEVARLLLTAGADPNALADMYDAKCTTLSMLVSSTPPAIAGVQVRLIDVLVDFGASVEPAGEGAWTSPVVTALVFGFVDAAEALVRRGARVDSLAAAAGLGRLDDVVAMLPDASPDDRHRALALAAQLGRLEVTRALLDAGQDPNRFNPPGMHAHGMPLHHAALYGHDAVVRLLVDRGARLDIEDTLFQATPAGWAEHGGHHAIAEFLRDAAAAPRRTDD